MNFSRVAFALFLILPCLVSAQTSIQYNSAEIRLGIQKLNTLGSVLYIAAHPDDENTRLLAYLAKEKKFRTGYLSLTRGDGGQNLIGNEQSELLGLIRTQELLAARRTDGAEQFFSRAIDFGFSKNSDETFRIWNHEQVLADAVWIIRKFRPDLIITRFPEDARAGHGQHAASAIIAHEAFLAAADPKRFPEQLQETSPWQAKRIVWNTFNFGGNNTISAGQLTLDAGGFNPLLGKSYGEVAAESRTNHKSQGFGSASQRGQAPEYFSHTAGDRAAEDIFEGINVNWDRVQGGELVGRLITGAEDSFDPEKPWTSVPALVNILNEVEKLKDVYWQKQKSEELKELIAAAAGLWFESYAPEPVYALGDSIPVRNEVLIQSALPVTLTAINSTTENSQLKNGMTETVSFAMPAPVLTQPYWLRDKHDIGMYQTPERGLTGHPENEPPLYVTFTFNIADKNISYTRPVVYKHTDQVRGEVYEPLAIAPPVTATIAGKAYVFKGNTPKAIQVRVKSFRAGSRGAIIPRLPAGWKAEPSQISFDLADKGQERTIEFLIYPGQQEAGGIFSLDIRSDGQTFKTGYQLIEYDHIPRQTLFPPAEAKVAKIDLQTGGTRIAYLPGAGDLIPQSLSQIGYELTTLSESQVLTGDLSIYDAIITGVRFYNVSGQVNLIQPLLMDYVNKGGTLLVQYNVSNPLPLKNIGPYPFRISRDRVTDERAEVIFQERNHPVLNYPNKITAKDFEGWIQERGLYFTSDADQKYARILSMNDPGESPKDGSLLVTRFGKGRFVYTSLAFFRELPAGIPGAYRLFVNLITKNKD